MGCKYRYTYYGYTFCWNTILLPSLHTPFVDLPGEKDEVRQEHRAADQEPEMNTLAILTLILMLLLCMYCYCCVHTATYSFFCAGVCAWLNNYTVCGLLCAVHRVMNIKQAAWVIRFLRNIA